MNEQILNQSRSSMQAMIAPAVVTMSSREIASLVEKRHDNVKRTIESLAKTVYDDDGSIKKPPVIGLPQIEEYLDTLGRPATEYLVCKRDSYIIVAQLSPEFTARLVDRWQELEAEAAPVLPRTLAEALRLAADKAEEAERLTVERDHAIATKAQIGSRREATAMATAAKHKREADKLKHELGRNARHATIIAVERATGLKFPKNAYVALRKWCKKNDARPVEVMDERYGSVKAWPAGAWLAEYDIVLGELFYAEAA